MTWASIQTRLAKKVYCCYEAGCFGYWLHRRLEAMGVTNFVVRPRNWDEYGQKVKTDQRDSAELLQNLDPFIAGNTRALQPVRVPSEEEERQRSESRQRDGFSKERKRLENQGTSAARYYGLSLPAGNAEDDRLTHLIVPLSEYTQHGQRQSCNNPLTLDKLSRFQGI